MTVRLTVGEQVLEQPFALLADPRIAVQLEPTCGRSSS